MSDNNSSNPLSDTLVAIMQTCAYEMREATTMLMYALAGIETYRKAFPDQPGISIPPELPGLSLSPIVSGTPPNDFLGPTGVAAQLLYKGWIEQVYGIWENRYRRKLQEVMDEHSPIPPESADLIRHIPPKLDALGDFRLIRNDLIHNGKASEENVKRCKILRWFKPGEDIILGLNHVFDFLNQISLGLSREVIDKFSGKAHIWTLVGDRNTLLAWEPAPKLVSVRSAAGSDPQVLYASIVFDNGVFGNGPLPCAMPDGEDVQEQPEGHVDLHINEDGDLVLPDKTVILASIIYTRCVDAYFDNPKGGGIAGPSMKTAEGS